MGNYFTELRWKIIGANNLLQCIHQVTTEIRFRKSLAQEIFKSNLEFRNQIIVSSIKFWKCFWKSMLLHWGVNLDVILGKLSIAQEGIWYNMFNFASAKK